MLCSGSFVAVRRIFISWGIRPALYKTDIVTVSDVMLYLILKFLKLVGYTTLTSCSTVLLPFHHSAMETLYFKKKKAIFMFTVFKTSAAYYDLSRY